MGTQSMGVLLCDYGAQNNVEKLQELVDSGVDLQEADYDSRTGLHLAASNGHIAAATHMLLDGRANPNVFDRFLNTPLDDAKREGHNALIALLSDHGGLHGN